MAKSLTAKLKKQVAVDETSLSDLRTPEVTARSSRHSPSRLDFSGSYSQCGIMCSVFSRVTESKQNQCQMRQLGQPGKKPARTILFIWQDFIIIGFLYKCRVSVRHTGERTAGASHKVNILTQPDKHSRRARASPVGRWTTGAAARKKTASLRRAAAV
jgi:hypothetical protein